MESDKVTWKLAILHFESINSTVVLWNINLNGDRFAFNTNSSIVLTSDSMCEPVSKWFQRESQGGWSLIIHFVLFHILTQFMCLPLKKSNNYFVRAFSNLLSGSLYYWYWALQENSTSFSQTSDWQMVKEVNQFSSFILHRSGRTINKCFFTCYLLSLSGMKTF